MDAYRMMFDFDLPLAVGAATVLLIAAYEVYVFCRKARRAR